ncbi:hypothetical protein LSH36_203g00043 [Paralvinella palmiformis]|uniref:Uncharacterized protein n=1 Tax=Paralvinella palmiformis TaxID=53620 RepID=A0AAD9JQR0_9ANNE|nr:hypothetical protein LSH36_203g00043 [Paralvinella palmiformis]
MDRQHQQIWTETAGINAGKLEKHIFIKQTNTSMYNLCLKNIYYTL